MKTLLIFIALLVVIPNNAQTYYDGIKIVSNNEYSIEIWDYDSRIKDFRWINQHETYPAIAKSISQWHKESEIYCTVTYGYDFHIRFVEDIGTKKRYTYLILRGGYDIDDKGNIIDETISQSTIILDGEKYHAGKSIPRPNFTENGDVKR